MARLTSEQLELIANPTRQTKPPSVNGPPTVIDLGDEMEAALKKLKGEAHYKDITAQVEKMRRSRGQPIPLNLDASIRCGLQRRCSKSKQYKGQRDLFRQCGHGVWKLANKK
jgi:hypothetical protein